jgi:hypothetical protein
VDEVSPDPIHIALRGQPLHDADAGLVSGQPLVGSVDPKNSGPVEFHFALVTAPPSEAKLTVVPFSETRLCAVLPERMQQLKMSR